MHDLELLLDNPSGQLALLGDTLGAAGISVEGGGMFRAEDHGVAHFLVQDGPAAAAALREAGLTVAACTPVLTARLDQDEPGQLGKICRAMADTGVAIGVLYSDHDGRLILVVDDPAQAQQVTDTWTDHR